MYICIKFTFVMCQVLIVILALINIFEKSFRISIQLQVCYPLWLCVIVLLISSIRDQLESCINSLGICAAITIHPCCPTLSGNTEVTIVSPCHLCYRNWPYIFVICCILQDKTLYCCQVPLSYVKRNCINMTYIWLPPHIYLLCIMQWAF